MLKKILKATLSLLLYLIYLGMVVLAIIYVVFWRPYFTKLEQLGKPKVERPEVVSNFSEATVRKIGHIIKGRTSAFYNKSYDKPEGVIRVCAFGDSFTYGDEVSNGNDYPAILQQLFIERGYSNVEVINYGISFTGLGQTYIMWDEVGKPMGCEFVLLGPQTLYWDRDTFFNHAGDSSPYYLHSLFHLGENDELIRVDVEGETHSERLADYYSFIPRWRYLRYEPRVPALFRSMIPPGKEVRNPLYYSSLNEHDHVFKLWSRLLDEFSRTESVQVIDLYVEKYNYDGIIERVPKSDNFSMALYALDSRFPHRAPGRHQSGFGNRILAERYFAQLTGEYVHSRRVALADAVGVKQGRTCESSASPPDPTQLVALNIQAGEEVIGYLYRASINGLGAVNFPAQQGRSMLAIADPHEQLGNAVYLSLTTNLHGHETLYLRVGDQRRVLGRIVKLSANPAMYLVRVPGFRVDDPGEFALSTDGYDTVSLAKVMYPELESIGERDYSLWIEDTQIYSGRRFQGLLTLEPVENNQYRFVGDSNGYGAMMHNAATGSLDLVWQYQSSDGATEVRCPFLTYHYEAAEYQPFAAAKYRIQKSSQGRAIKVVRE